MFEHKSAVSFGVFVLVFPVLEHFQRVLCLQRFWTDHDEAAGGQLDWLCYSHLFIYLMQTFVEWHVLDISHHIQLISYIFNQEGFCKSVVLGKVTPEPFDHVVLSCCLPGGEKKKFFGEGGGCGSLWCCELSFKLAFLSLCRKKRVFEEVHCFIFSLFHYVYLLYLRWWWLCHLSLWPSLLKKILLVAMQAVQPVFVMSSISYFPVYNTSKRPSLLPRMKYKVKRGTNKSNVIC